MTAVPVRIANAVVTEINDAVTAETFSTLGFTAARRYYDWDREYTGLDSLLVEVVFRTTQPTGSVDLETAGHLDYTIATDIVVLQRFGASDRSSGRLKNSSIDPLVLLVEELNELFIGERTTNTLDDETNAKWLNTDLVSWCNQSLLRELGVFEGVVRVEFGYWKSI